MKLLVLLILAHLIGDFPAQAGKWVADKKINKARSPYLYLHVAIHGVLATLALIIAGQTEYWPLVLIITLGHLGIDLLKLYRQDQTNHIRWFIADQLLHLLLIITAWALVTGQVMRVLSFLKSDYFLIHITAVFFLTQPLSIIIAKLMDKWIPYIDDAASTKALPKAGMYIGMLERVFAYGLIMTGNWSGIGFLLAAKSVFRFGDLRQAHDRKLTEYILIGSLLSFGTAAAVALLAENLLNLK
ncbi:MAG TPA: DUF3307 domain-containing protein [Cryomorphaceae bacterium]|nr:hypothetical protein [Owenweeksia sp.]MBG00367.1 hypothetical protein [Owenweeksia sp.]HAD97021.1 DUF3307 domain-containing protein [Cryomorphaceae bacterium]HBF19814.1 DUF3307 domain-containing protein [Cryomorphaceae bacterium]|tara:strand:- start:2549 stop:3277 length:729 start_codon:yes stop_codon:yes gene_type:complete